MSTTIEIRTPRFQMPAVAGIIERRMLVNFRCRPDVLQKVLPVPFRPKLINGWGMAGICLIRLSAMRPNFLPAVVGLTSENAAHRIAVEWDDGGITREGVFIPRRDTNALLNRLVGGKLFPGVHQAATFRVSETSDHFELEMRSKDGVTFVCVHGHVADMLPLNSIFKSLNEASEFFQSGSLGWSSRATENIFDGLELSCDKWRMKPMTVERAESSFFENLELFPAGSAMFDSAFLMRNIPHEWHARGQLYAERTKL
jgi:hypothetical protein